MKDLIFFIGILILGAITGFGLWVWVCMFIEGDIKIRLLIIAFMICTAALSFLDRLD